MEKLYSCRKCIRSLLCVVFVIFSCQAAEKSAIEGNFDFQNYKAIYYNIPLVLQCNVTTSSPESMVLTWRKNDTTIDVSDSRVKVEAGQNTLTISPVTELDAGNYTCVVTNKKSNATELRLDFIVLFKPYVKVPPNTSVVEGEKLTITCTVIGVPLPEVSWLIGNKTVAGNERIKVLEHKEKKVPNAILQIDEATMEDRDTYTCVATDRITGNTTESATYVRVKDKFAALWPFLGICVEVVILCTVILIYEKKRNKTELDESDTDGSPEQKNTPDHGKDSEVRHRK